MVIHIQIQADNIAEKYIKGKNQFILILISNKSARYLPFKGHVSCRVSITRRQVLDIHTVVTSNSINDNKQEAHGPHRSPE